MREAMDNGNVDSGNEFVRTPAPSSSSHSHPSPSPSSSQCASVASEKEEEGEVCGEGVSSSSRTDLKNSLLQLDQQRKEIEAEIAQLNELLNAEIGAGLHGPLVDAEDYPRSDIDVQLARISRHRVACLQTDHNHVMTHIQAKLHQLHALERSRQHPQPHSHQHSGCTSTGSSSVSSPSPPSPKHRCETDPRPFMPGPQAAPFLRVQQVIEGSPAARGGLRNQDLVIRLGSITGSNFSGNLNSIGSLLAGYQGQVLGVEVLRETAPNNPLRLSLTPQVWSGRGLLGCKMHPLLPPP